MLHTMSVYGCARVHAGAPRVVQRDVRCDGALRDGRCDAGGAFYLSRMLVVLPIPCSSLLNWLHRGVYFFARTAGSDKAAMWVVHAIIV